MYGYTRDAPAFASRTYMASASLVTARSHHAAHLPPSLRVWHRLKRLLYKLIGHPSLLSHYTRHPAAPALTTAYMLLEDVAQTPAGCSRTCGTKGEGTLAGDRHCFEALLKPCSPSPVFRSLGSVHFVSTTTGPSP